MESPGAHTQSRLSATAAALALLSLLALALPLTRAGDARASSTAAAGGTAPPASTPSASGGAAVKSGTRPSPGKGPTGGTATGKSKSGATSTKAPARTGTATAVKIAGARCVPVTSCGTKQHEVSTHGNLLMQGSGLRSGESVAFPRSWHARIASNSPSAHLHMSKLGLVVTVPASAHSGSIEVRLTGGRHSNAFGPISVVTYKLHPPVPKMPPATPPPTSTATTASGTAFAGQGMWIWYISASDGGNVASIVAQAHAAGVTTLFVKSSDGSSNYWSQFSPQLVAELHANGLKVCAWQYVYGTNPTGEAELGAEAVANGADCLVIDAESEYEGHYAAAQKYIETLRAKIGPSYPLGLASFPYVSYHPSFPYSVFLGPGGAQFNAPQMYWHDIGTSVAQVFVTTFEQNLIYGRPILPLGQTYGGVSATEIVSFRSLATAYGASGDSFWDWQETSSSGWTSLAAPLNTALTVPQPELTSPLLHEGSKSDQVLWLQEHLASAIPGQPTTGIFEATTKANLESFQTAHAIPPSGETDPSTWAALLALAPVAVNWTGSGPQT
jgi:Putative peptidoglycan binding domain